ncbi:patatin-like phospholipase family protein [Radiobacillus deserti]|uniref:patatin-like phospholipase family protein n=1 Tax=Radiobacillus deserti TaxID=2594883 RepID=UPI0013155C1F|nr:patatin-like phospholipase family protein [Radiobacillus deserti]
MRVTGVALGGGCLRGVAHIGALKELLNHDISITHVAGTSAGAVIGGLFACGLHPDKMVNALDSLSIRKHLDFGFNKKGWLKGDRIYNTLLQLTDGKYFSDLDIPLAVVCVDLISRQLTIIREGEVAKALRASIAIPGVFSPVQIGKKLLVDGYILNNNPADIVKEMGAKHVTAIRVLSSNYQNQSPTSLISYMNRYMDIASSLNTDQLLKRHADVIMDIDLVNVGRFAPKSIPMVIEKGQTEARKVLTREFLGEAVGNVIYMEQWREA